MKTLQKLSLKQLIARMEKAQDFKYDDEAMEMYRRGLKFRWTHDNKLIYWNETDPLFCKKCERKAGHLDQIDGYCEDCTN